MNFIKNERSAIVNFLKVKYKRYICIKDLEEAIWNHRVVIKRIARMCQKFYFNMICGGIEILQWGVGGGGGSN